MYDFYSTFKRWAIGFELSYRFNKKGFIISALTLLLLFVGWTLLCTKRQKKDGNLRNLGYCIIFLFALTNLFRLPHGSSQYILLPGWSYLEIFCHNNMFLMYENVANFLVYIPIGYLV